MWVCKEFRDRARIHTIRLTVLSPKYRHKYKNQGQTCGIYTSIQPITKKLKILSYFVIKNQKKQFKYM